MKELHISLDFNGETLNIRAKRLKWLSLCFHVFSSPALVDSRCISMHLTFKNTFFNIKQNRVTFNFLQQKCIHLVYTQLLFYTQVLVNFSPRHCRHTSWTFIITGIRCEHIRKPRMAVISKIKIFYRIFIATKKRENNFSTFLFQEKKKCGKQTS